MHDAANGGNGVALRISALGNRAGHSCRAGIRIPRRRRSWPVVGGFATGKFWWADLRKAAIFTQEWRDLIGRAREQLTLLGFVKKLHRAPAGLGLAG